MGGGMHEIARVRALLAALRTLFVFCHLTVATRRRGDLIPGVTETIVTMLLTCSKAGIKSRSTHPGTVRVVRCFKADSLSWPAHPGTFRAARATCFNTDSFLWPVHPGRFRAAHAIWIVGLEAGG